MRKSMAGIALLLLLFAAGCGNDDSEATDTTDTTEDTGDAGGETAGMANPAAVYCEEQGGTSEIRTAEDGSQSGACVFDNGSECDDWAYFRGECAPEGEEPLGSDAPGAIDEDATGESVPDEGGDADGGGGEEGDGS